MTSDKVISQEVTSKGMSTNVVDEMEEQESKSS